MITLPTAFARGVFVTLPAFSLLPAGMTAAPPQDATSPPRSSRAEAYYHYALAHLQMERAGQYGRREYWDNALKEYQAAIAADPDSEFLKLELVRFYGRTDRLDDAVKQAEAMLAENPKNIEVRRTLGRFLAAYATSSRGGGVDQDLLARAVEQHEKILEVDPNDTDALMKLSGFYQALEQPGKAEGVLDRLLAIEPTSVEALSNLAQLYRAQGRTADAIGALEKVCDSGQSGPRQLAMLAELYEHTGRNDDAAALLEKVREMGGDNSSLRASLARNWAASGQYDKALRAYQKLSQEEPNNPDYHLRLSQIYRQKRRFKEARNHIEKATDLAPDSMEIRYNGILLYEAEGRSEAAIEELEKLLSETAKDGYTQREKRNRSLFIERLGILYRDQGNIARAVEVFEGLAELDPEAKPSVVSHLVDTFRSAKDYERALKVSNEGAEDFPDNRLLLMQRASLLADNGSWEQGSELLKAVLEQEPDNRHVILALAHVYERGRRYDDAVKTVEKAADLATTDAQKRSVLFTQGSVLERAKRYDEAEKKFRELIAKHPDDSSALNYLGYMLADIGKGLDEAHDMIQKALDLDPDNGAYLDSLGWLYYRQQKFELAERYLVRSLEKVKGDPVVHSHLGDVYFKQGKVEQARKHWELSIEEWKNGPAADRDPKEIAKLESKISELSGKLSTRVQEKKP